MVDDKSVEGTRHGAFLIRECIETVPGLGSIYTAHHVDTGAPALVMLGPKGAIWSPEGAWELGFSGGRDGKVRMKIYKSPPSAQHEDLKRLMDLATDMVRSVEKNPRLQAHFEEAARLQRSWRFRVRRAWRSWWVRAALILALLGLGLGVGYLLSTQMEPAPGDELPGEDAPALAE
ncbi:hypothetical protein [Melittangium boletus]|uniref:Uncharacterized protein n=1 Tax=Melittangium boletus DSM 14713 TaxID=1294270 RepID=A0A250IDY4_9BACT|nr:hypothetical protein [Melittangium boletus]ATB29438.1 hypothetical protein MEBOL_002887 [Melittangium boletus DSM 14713]